MGPFRSLEKIQAGHLAGAFEQRGSVFYVLGFKRLKKSQALSGDSPYQEDIWTQITERKGPIPTFHKTVKEVGIVPISIFPNLKIGT